MAQGRQTIFHFLNKPATIADLRKYAAIAVGLIAIVFWVALFTAGLNINSNYYRAAISYDFASVNDWLMTIFSFTLTNVILLAFLSGFLGGICSKIIVTQGFTLSTKELIAEGRDNVLFETPFISAFRGVFVFIALLTFQYVSSFSDLSSIDKSTKSLPVEKDYAAVYNTMLDSLSDSASRQVIKQVWLQEQAKMEEANSDTLVYQILLLRDSVNNYPKSEKAKMWNEKIKGIRLKLQIPELADIPGLSASGYFRFAVIVSLLAFICGYDPKRFNSFLRLIPLMSKKDEDSKGGSQKEPDKSN